MILLRYKKIIFNLSQTIKTIATNAMVCNKKLANNWGSKKSKDYKILYVEKVMPHLDSEVDSILSGLRKSIDEQKHYIESLRESGAQQTDLQNAVNELKRRIELLRDRELSLAPQTSGLDRLKMEILLKKRFFIENSFKIYGGMSGHYDFGPMGCAMKTNVINVWRNHFILEEQMLEVDCTVLTPEPVLRASGHIERFADLMVKDVITGECFRLDHLIKSCLEKLMHDKKCGESEKREFEDVITKLVGYSKDEMNAVLRKYGMKSPISGNELTDAIEFNLMFSTSIGPTGAVKGYLRPETAQGIFVNFKRLLDFNQRRLPFASAQIGNAFRNEISPRSGLIRVREFTLAEIEHFVDPSDKSHSKYDSIKDQILTLYSACNQMDGKPSQQITIENAVNSGMIANQTLAYFLARVHLFLIKVGINSKRLRFRQHMSNEMAHYASDCWDAECLTSYGWVECVGCADRSCYDLSQHSKATGIKLIAERDLTEPVEKDVIECFPRKAIIRKKYNTDSTLIIDALRDLDSDQLTRYETEILNNGYFIINTDEKQFEITKDMIAINRVKKMVSVEEIIPGVIEPSFGIGRIMLCILEHNFHMRDGDQQRTYFSLPPIIAPLSCAVLPLINHSDLKPFVKKISKLLTENKVFHRIEDGRPSIGRRYTRVDEIAIPFGITIDFDTINTNTITLRERDSMQQIRVPIEKIGPLVHDLSNDKITWNELTTIYSLFKK